MKNSIAELASSSGQQAFGQAKSDSLPTQCRNCRYLFACHGGCPKNRLDESGVNYLCSGHKAFFEHTERPMRIMADLLKHRRYADEIMGILASEENEIHKDIRVTGGTRG